MDVMTTPAGSPWRGFCLVANLLGIVLVGKGVLLMNQGASAGIGLLFFGTLILLCSPWIQHSFRDADNDWAPPAVWVVLMGLFAVYAFMGMINPLI